MMFEHALVAVGLGPAGDVLVGCAPALKALGTRRLTLLRVAPVDYPVAGAVSHLDDYRERLEGLAADLREQGFQVDVDARPGNPRREILRAAEEVGASLILIGSRSRSRVREAFVGSVTLKVLEETTIPVLYLRIEPDGPGNEAPLAAFCCPMDGPILVATDFSPASERAASVAAALARKEGRRPVVLLHVVEGGGDGATASSSSDPLEALAARLRERGVADVETRCVQGDRADAIVAAVSEQDEPLLVMGTRGLGLIRRVALGSASRNVLERIRSPVLLVPEAEK
jgi:nucleotide-binding universal stress UspA family protein